MFSARLLGEWLGIGKKPPLFMINLGNKDRSLMLNLHSKGKQQKIIRHSKSLFFYDIHMLFKLKAYIKLKFASGNC